MKGEKPPFFVMANADPMGWIDAGLDVDHLGLHLLAWAESSTHALDGRIAGPRIRRMPGWTQRRQDRLVAHGIWLAAIDDEIVLADYLALNRTRSEITALRAERQKAGARGGQTTAATAPRGLDGQFLGPRR